MTASTKSPTKSTMTLRRLKQPPLGHKKALSQLIVRDTNKRRCVASPLASQTPAKTVLRDNGPPREEEKAEQTQEEKRQFPIEKVMHEVEDEGGGENLLPDEISTDIAVITAKNKQLQTSVASLQRQFLLQEDHTHQLLVGLGALNAVTNELERLQKEYQERSEKHTALIQEVLVQIIQCSAQVDTLKQTQGWKKEQLHQFQQECAEGMHRLIVHLYGDGGEKTHKAFYTEDGADDVVCTTTACMREQVEHLKEEVCEQRVQVVEDRCVRSVGGQVQQEVTYRINQALEQLDNLHADMFQLKQTFVQDHQSFRRHLEDHLSQQIAHTREVQDNEKERMHEEMDEIRSGMCGILKDIHRLKERTKYLVPSMAQSSSLPLKVLGRSCEDRWMSSIPVPSSTTPMPYDYSYDWVMPHHLEAYHAHLYHPHRTKPGISSPEKRIGDDMFTPEAVSATGQQTTQSCERLHYSSCASSLSGHLSVYRGTSILHVYRNDRASCVPRAAGARTVGTNIWTKWRYINLVDCTRLRRRE